MKWSFKIISLYPYGMILTKLILIHCKKSNDSFEFKLHIDCLYLQKEATEAR